MRTLFVIAITLLCGCSSDRENPGDEWTFGEDAGERPDAGADSGGPGDNDDVGPTTGRDADTPEPRDTNVEPCVVQQPHVFVDGMEENPAVVAFGAEVELRATDDARHWVVVDPAGTWSEETDALTLDTTVIGEHQISLDIPTANCVAWTGAITVEPPPGDFAIQLLWHNPEDPAPRDDVGADLDLHLVKMGPGAWFEQPWDLYYRNRNLADEAIWVEERPQLLLEDRDGRGPETVLLPEADDCEWYAVGVHYYRQLFGTAEVTLQVYRDGALSDEVVRELAAGGAFLDVARIHWPSGTVVIVDEVLDTAPASESPTVPDGMSQSGLCTDEMLY